MTIVYLLSHIALGLAIYRGLFFRRPERESSRLRTVTTAFGIGMGFSYWLALLASAGGERFVLGLGLWLGLPAVALVAWLGWRGRRTKPIANGHTKRSVDACEAVLIGMLVVLSTTVLVQAVTEPLKSWDARAIYGTTAKILYHEGGVRGESITSPDRIHYHRNYPLLIAYHEASIWEALGDVSERPGKAIFPAFFIGIVGLVYSLFRKRLGRLLTLLLVVSFASPPFFAFYHDGGGISGYADVPFAFFWGAAVAYLFLFFGDRDWRYVLIAAFFQSCAIATKNEGLLLTLPLAVIFAAALWIRPLVRPRWRRLAPAAGLMLAVFAFSAPWLLIRGTLPSFLDEGYLHRILNDNPLDRLAQTPELLQAILRDGFQFEHWGIVWLVYLAAPFVAWRAGHHRVTLFLVALAVSQILLYFVVYLYSPHDIGWHVDVSWNRLLIHVLPVAALTCGVQLAALVRRPDPPAMT